jgi:hypothetical protein
MTRIRSIRRLLLPLALLGLLVTASPALACDGGTVQTILFQAAKYGRVNDGYSVSCLRQAQSSQTADMLTYSSSDSALRGAITRAAAPRPTKRYPQAVEARQAAATTATVAVGDSGPLARLINAGAQSPGEVPLPVVFLGGLAVLMIGGGAASFLLRRRIEPVRGPRPPASS